VLTTRITVLATSMSIAYVHILGGDIINVLTTFYYSGIIKYNLNTLYM